MRTLGRRHGLLVHPAQREGGSLPPSPRPHAAARLLPVVWCQHSLPTWSHAEPARAGEHFARASFSHLCSVRTALVRSLSEDAGKAVPAPIGWLVPGDPGLAPFVCTVSPAQGVQFNVPGWWWTSIFLKAAWVILTRSWG